MNFNEAMQMLGTKLQGKYGHLGFKYKKSDKTLTRHSKNFTYMIAFSSFGGNTKDSISIEVCYIINTRPYDPYGYAKPDINTQPLFYSLRDNEIYLDRKAADPSIPHTYAWFVMADTNTPQEIIRQDLTLEEAIQIYQDSNTSEKRLGVIKDGIATVDFVHFQSGEQQFFTDHEKLESFRSDLVVAEAMERLYQQLNQPDIGIRMGEM